MSYRIEDTNAELEVWQGDITTLEVDAIVNAANKRMLGGGGVDGAIHAVAGPELKAACEKLPILGKGPGGMDIRCHTGGAIITDAFNLPCRFVIHTVGPRWQDSPANKSMLSDCYSNSLLLADEAELTSVAFSCISTGVYGYPKDFATPVACKAVIDFLQNRPESSIQKIIFVCFEPEDAELYNQFLTEE